MQYGKTLLQELRYGYRGILRQDKIAFARLSGRYFVTDRKSRIVYCGTVFHVAVAVAKRHGVFTR